MKTYKVIRALSVTGLLSLLLLAAGCKGIATTGEKAARQQVQGVAASYRPAGQKPALPVLTPDCGLSNFLRYAMLNQPNVEAAYYDWAASVERITTARSFPDPQVTFHGDWVSAVAPLMKLLCLTVIDLLLANPRVQVQFLLKKSVAYG